MTNGEKFREIFSISQVDEGELYAYMWLPSHDAVYIPRDWWKAEYNEPVICDNGVKNELNRVKNELEPTTKNDLGVDCISRAAARSLICKIDLKHPTFGMSRKVFKDLYNGMDELPSVTPQPRKGHWIPTYGNVKCSVCGSVKDSREVGKATHYCDFCGAKMETEDT